jgi:mycoredoxin-dependent peroxiredoxin
MDAPAAAALPRLGERFPTIVLRGPGNHEVRVPEDFAGKVVVLSWYPFAFSPVCTEELSGFAKVHQEFERRGAVVVAVSCDHWYTTEAYRRSLGAPWPFLSDWDRTEAHRLGIFHEGKRRPDRHIYLLDRQGVLRWHRHYPQGCPTLADFQAPLDDLA